MIREDIIMINESEKIELKEILVDEVKKEKGSDGKVVIEDDVWVGSNAIILHSVKIGRGAVIGAGSVVTKDVEPYAVIVGYSAKKIKNRFSDEEIVIHERQLENEC